MRQSKILAKSVQVVKHTTEITSTYSAEWFGTKFAFSPLLKDSEPLHKKVSPEHLVFQSGEQEL